MKEESEGKRRRCKPTRTRTWRCSFRGSRVWGCWPAQRRRAARSFVKTPRCGASFGHSRSLHAQHSFEDKALKRFGVDERALGAIHAGSVLRECLSGHGQRGDASYSTATALCMPSQLAMVRANSRLTSASTTCKHDARQSQAWIATAWSAPCTKRAVGDVAVHLMTRTDGVAFLVCPSCVLI